MIIGFHLDNYWITYYTIIMAVYFTDIIYTHSKAAHNMGCSCASYMMKFADFGNKARIPRS